MKISRKKIIIAVASIVAIVLFGVAAGKLSLMEYNNSGKDPRTSAEPVVDRSPEKEERTVKSEDPGDPVVYVTPYGKCYHTMYCGHLRDVVIPLELETAQKRGYRPCEDCDP